MRSVVGAPGRSTGVSTVVADGAGAWRSAPISATAPNARAAARARATRGRRRSIRWVMADGRGWAGRSPGKCVAAALPDASRGRGVLGFHALQLRVEPGMRRCHVRERGQEGHVVLVHA